MSQANPNQPEKSLKEWLELQKKPQETTFSLSTFSTVNSKFLLKADPKPPSFITSSMLIEPNIIPLDAETTKPKGFKEGWTISIAGGISNSQDITRASQKFSQQLKHQKNQSPQNGKVLQEMWEELLKMNTESPFNASIGLKINPLATQTSSEDKLSANSLDPEEAVSLALGKRDMDWPQAQKELTKMVENIRRERELQKARKELKELKERFKELQTELKLKEMYEELPNIYTKSPITAAVELKINPLLTQTSSEAKSEDPTKVDTEKAVSLAPGVENPYSACAGEVDPLIQPTHFE